MLLYFGRLYLTAAGSCDGAEDSPLDSLSSIACRDRTISGGNSPASAAGKKKFNAASPNPVSLFSLLVEDSLSSTFGLSAFLAFALVAIVLFSEPTLSFVNPKVVGLRLAEIFARSTIAPPMAVPKVSPLTGISLEAADTMSFRSTSALGNVLDCSATGVAGLVSGVVAWVATGVAGLVSGVVVACAVSFVGFSLVTDADATLFASSVPTFFKSPVSFLSSPKPSQPITLSAAPDTVSTADLPKSTIVSDTADAAFSPPI